MRRWIASLLLPAFGLAAGTTWSAAAAPPAGRPVDVVVVLSEDSGIYAEALQSLESHLHSEAPGTVAIRVVSLADASGIEADLAVPVGAEATRVVLDFNGDLPVLSLLVSEAVFNKLHASFSTKRKPGGAPPVSAVYLDQPVDRQVALGRVILPEARRVGVLIGAKQPELERHLQRSASRTGLGLEIEALTEEGQPAVGIKRLLRKVDWVAAVYDPGVLNAVTAKWLLYMAYQRRVPVLGFSQSYVKAGALAAVYSTPAQMGRQAAERILRWRRRGSDDLGEPEFPRYFDVAINQPVAHSLGLKLPEESEISKRIGQILETVP